MENQRPKSNNQLKGIISIVILIIVIWYFWGGGVEKQANNEMQKIENKVAYDAVQQYEIAKRQGDKMQTYVQAGLVAAAYLQAKDEENYRKWKEIEKEDAKAAGIEMEKQGE